MNKQLLVVSAILPALLIIPLSDAYAYPLENYELKFETTFSDPSLENMQTLITYLDGEGAGSLHNIFYESFAEIAVGQFDPVDLEADWNLKFQEGEWTIVFNPVILYINVATGVNHATVQDQALDDGRNQVGVLLNSLGYDTYTQTVYYEGGSQTFEVTP